MKKGIYAILFMLFSISLLFLWGCEEEEITFPNQTNKGIANNQGTVEEVKIASQFTGELKTVNVYLPAEYDVSDDKTYPVVYFLHGFGGDENTWLNGFMLKELVDVLIADGVIQPMILVMPNAKNPLGGSFYTNSIDTDPNRNPTFNPALGFGCYEFYTIQEVMGTVEAQYKIDPQNRAIQGHSMGGYGAMKLAMLYPTMFKSVASHSGPLSFNELLSNENSNFLARVAMENIDPVTGDPLPVIDLNYVAASPTTHPLTVTMFGLASSFAPHFGSAGTFDTYLLSIGVITDPTVVYMHMVSPTPVDTAGPGPADDIYPGVDLPVRITTPGAMADTVTSAWLKFLANDCYTMLATGKKPDQTALDVESFKALNIYVDCGNQDDFDPMDDGAGFGIIYNTNKFDELLTTLGITHRYERYTGAHSSDVYYRVEVALKEHDIVFLNQ